MTGGVRRMLLVELVVLASGCDLSRVPYSQDNDPSPSRTDVGVVVINGDAGTSPSDARADGGAIATDATTGDTNPRDDAAAPDASDRDAGNDLDGGPIRADADAGTTPADAASDAAVLADAAADAGFPRDVGFGRDAGPGAALGASCTRNTDCASYVCFDRMSGGGGRCVVACGGDADCPAGYTCWDENGGRMCLPANAFTSADFSRASGEMCTSNGQCHSNYCNTMQCNTTCAADDACGGARCVWRNPGGSSDFISACSMPTGTIEDRSSCTMSAQCRSGACVDGLCRTLCRSSASCRPNELCSIEDFSKCTLELATECLEWEPNFVKVCMPRAATATNPTGTSCTMGATCVGGLCHLTTVNACTETCSSDDDCPLTHRCKLERYDTLGDHTIYVNICVPERT